MSREHATAACWAVVCCIAPRPRTRVRPVHCFLLFLTEKQPRVVDFVMRVEGPTLLSRLALRWRHDVPFIRQSETADCALACVAMVSASFGNVLDYSNLRRRFPPSDFGLTLTTVREVASAAGLSSRAVEAGTQNLRHVRAPAI